MLHYYFCINFHFINFAIFNHYLIVITMMLLLLYLMHYFN